MQKPVTRPYGLWESPFSARSMSSGMRLYDVQWDSDGRTLVWLESRSGKNVLVSVLLDSADAPRDLTDDVSVRAQVGYGGGDFTVSNGTIFFVERKSGQIYRQDIHQGETYSITPAFGHAAAPTVSPNGQWVLYVHSYEDVDVLAVVDAEGQQWPQRLTIGHDFYMQPRWHPDNRRIAYISWDHPHMPWDGTMLYIATLHEWDGPPSVVDSQIIAGGPDVAIFQPEFSPDGRWLAYVSDASGWSHIYIYDLEQGTHRMLTNGETEHGKPAWVQGMHTYGWSHDSQQIYFVRNDKGFGALYRQAVDGGEPEQLAGLDAYTWFEQPALSPTAHKLATIASSSTQSVRLIVWDDTVRIMRRTTTEKVAPSYLSEAKPVSWDIGDGEHVHGLLYSPNSRYNYDAKGFPPAIIRIHGGPTAQAVASFLPEVQFFTTRGYVVLLLNYRGSTGYGRAYMEALRFHWGVRDVEDAISAARYLTEQGIADGSKMVLMGGSAGGYTVLETLCRITGMFKAGICSYGVSDMLSLAADTHKFEARYLDTMLGPLPESSAVYRERSPIFHAHLLNEPVILFQGTEDRIVPREQSDKIADSLRKRGIPHEYHVYEGEGHGWRKPETIEKFYTTIDAFLRKYVLFA